MKKREENQRKWKKDNRDESKAGKKTGNLFAVESGEQRIGERRAKKKTKQMMYTRKQRERVEDGGSFLHLQSGMAVVCLSFLYLLSLPAIPPSLPRLLPVLQANYCRERHHNLMMTKKDGDEEDAVTTVA